MQKDNYQWHKIADSEKDIILAENGIGVIELAGRKLCLTKWTDRWFGFSYLCPHAGGSLSQGYIDSFGNIVCPSHHYRFSLLHGRDSAEEGYRMKLWPIENRGDGIYIRLDGMGFLVK